MKRFLADRPWLFVVVLLAIFVAANLAVLVAAQLSHGPDVIHAP
ncbi:hypothetical protein [Vulgatibacter incomptus]|uniref:Uncharacterized protein n=1 Tax=Vulgatibacter incomptus TaxID=1391653 RepID=A0A0K1PHH2_9BACT|nr:hypothetical protein [Vulgatibacter incomptus]AKU92988.1 hypothetical protein AKJ08_3375 [Vulgatibacter incomptus]